MPTRKIITTEVKHLQPVQINTTTEEVGYNPSNPFLSGTRLLQVDTPNEDHLDAVIEYLQHVASDDLLKPPTEKIDTLILAEPLAGHFRALRNLSPTYLEVSGGWNERIDIRPLNDLNWTTLRTLTLGDLCSFPENGPDDWPFITSRLESLIITYSIGVNFNSPAGFGSLKKFKIVENGAMDMFINAYEDIEGFAGRLEVLDLQTTNGCDMQHQYELADFRERLKKCVGLKALKIALAQKNWDVDLAHSMPPNLEKLEFHCSTSPTMLKDLENWVEAAKDPEWLPRLLSIGIKCDARNLDPIGGGFGEKKGGIIARNSQFRTIINKIYEILGNRRVSVEASLL